MLKRRISRVRDMVLEKEFSAATLTLAMLVGLVQPALVEGASVWSGSEVPAVASAPDSGSVELGVRFRTNVDGFVTGVRFYKGASNTGTHVGSIWNSGGARLAAATFANESASGWQQVNFGGPVAVTANTDYVVSYFAPNGGYSYDRNFFASTGLAVGPLYLLRNGEVGGNGVYAYGAASLFPGNTFQSTNYWVDVVFEPGTPAPRNCSANAVAAENCLSGNPASEWDVVGAGDPTIQGFATSISVNRGESVSFKVKTDAAGYRFDIYRLGHYDGLGARKVATLLPTAALPQSQPNCLVQASTGLIDCGNWGISGTWAVPSNAVSGVYVARLVRDDAGGASHIPFVVRDDNGTSDVLFQTADTTWQAYNSYGGNSLYVGQPANRAYKVSYNRPFNTRGVKAASYLFNAEYPMIRWLEANGYDVSYTTGVDTDRHGALISNHRVFMSNGHDEYWAGAQRSNVESARDAGVHLAFFSGNEMFWKSRWENSIDGTDSPYRTLVCYKETHANAKIDPDATWTGTWRDARFSPPSDGGHPENGLTGTLFKVNEGATASIVVSAEDGRMRFWRSTSVAALSGGTSATLPFGTLGYEWDEDADNGFRPPGLVRLSTATVSGAPVLQDQGSTYATGTATHSLTLYRSSSGALVFGAGTVQWAWGLDSSHDRGSAAPDSRMQQATVNLLADMGVQPGTLQAGLASVFASTDTARPTSSIATPAAGSTVQLGSAVTFAGSATDAGGVVGGVEVSLDGGATWRRASGRAAWSYTWTPSTTGQVVLRSRAADDSGNVEVAGAGRVVNVSATAGSSCPCSAWGSADVPMVAAATDSSAVELGMKFRSTVNGYVTGIRFYKGTGNSGTHSGSLWSASGVRLATANFSNESATGWQQVAFAAPVPIAANTIYVVSYFAPQGHYAYSRNYFSGAGVTRDPLYLLRDGESGGNGVYAYGSGSLFPSNSFQATNYWVDVVFEANAGSNTPPVVTNPGAQLGTFGIATSLQIQASDGNGDSLSYSATGLPAGMTIDASTGLIEGTPTATGTSSVAVTVIDGRGGSGSAAFDWAINAGTVPGSCPCSAWGSADVPAVAAATDSSAVELGMKFRSTVNGYVTGIRFYKGTGNSGTHSGSLWSASGVRLATATFSNESATGWQQVAFAAPVPIAANTVYVVSYFAPQGHYAYSRNYFSGAGVTRDPLYLLRDGESGGNGVYAYGSGSLFPVNTYQSTNYWVDVVLVP